MIRRLQRVEDVLSVIEEHFDDGQLDRVGQELARAREDFPENLTLLEWEAVLAFEEERPAEALRLICAVLERDPERRFALREKANVLYELGRFEDACELLSRVGPEGDRDAGFHFQLGSCQDRLGRASEAFASLERAAEIQPREYTSPIRLTNRQFETLVSEAVDRLPGPLREFLARMEIVIEDYPDPSDPAPFAYCLYHAALRTARGSADAVGEPLDRLSLFKRNLELEVRQPERLRDEIARTIAYEIANQFGFEEDPMLGAEPD